jgi:23S rRNA (pseudouridine1915-N3)-methyltransferase
MKIQIITPWKQKGAELLALEKEYVKRLSSHWPIEMREVKSLDPAQFKGFVVALDERGQNFSTTELAQKLDGKTAITFVIGEADGLTDVVRAKADLLISFGKLTWPHKLVRVMLCEQIYRIWSVLNNHPYHRE